MSIPFPVLAALICIGLIVSIVYTVGLTKKWGILLPFAGMLLFGSMSLPLDWNDRINPTVWLPIQRIRSELFLVSGAAGLLLVFFQISRLRGKKLSISVWTLVLAGMYAALLRFVHDSPSEGAFSVAFGICTLIPVALTATIVMDSLDDLVTLLRTVALTNIVWIFMVIIQIGANPKYVTMGNELRFVGILANPQHSGVLMAFFCVITLWLLTNDSRKLKAIYTILLGINCLFLLWTGSRTGLGMTIIGVSSILYTRVGRVILLLPLVGILTYVGLKVVVNVIDIDFGLNRLASTTNTRDYAWWKLLNTGLENPLFGVGTLESEKSENSWLFGFAAFGIGMLVMTIAMTFFAMWECFRLFRTRSWLPKYYRPYADLVIGIMAMYFAGAVLEGYIISRVSAALCIFPLAAGAGAMIRKFASEYRDGNYVTDEYETYSEYGDTSY